MASFFTFTQKKTISIRLLSTFCLLVPLASAIPAYAYDDDPTGWTNDRVYSISNKLGWLARHRMNGTCGIALISYENEKVATFKTMPIELRVDKSGTFIRSGNMVKNLKTDDEVKIHLTLGPSKYVLPMVAEEDPSVISAELEDSQLKLIVNLLSTSPSMTIEFPNDKKPTYYPLHGIQPLIRSLKDCVYVNGFADIE